MHRRRLTVNIVGKPDTSLITEHILFPLNTRFTAENSRVYRYIVDERGYRWIGEELWMERQLCLDSM